VLVEIDGAIVVTKKTARSCSDGPRTTVKRYVPSGTDAGNSTTSCVSVTLTTVIGVVSQ